MIWTPNGSEPGKINKSSLDDCKIGKMQKVGHVESVTTRSECI